jgi:ABC-2 type transport system ATP-binding protein
MSDGIINDTIIAASNLSKSYNHKPALRGLDLAVPRGSICGFLGRNGAGKTTTLKLLLGMLRPDAGEIRLFGEPVDAEKSAIAARRRTAFVSEDKELYPFMNVGQTIRFTRPFFPAWRRDLEEKHLRLFRLPLEKPVRQLSKGMRTQLMLLLAISRGAELLIMDEPTSGLDPVMTEEILQALADLAATSGATMFLASHQLTEVEQICDRVCLIDEGQIVIDGLLDDLKSQYRRILLVFDGEPPATLADLPGVDNIRRRGRTASLLAHEDVDALLERTRGLGPRSVEVRPVSLKELFLEHVKGE